MTYGRWIKKISIVGHEYLPITAEQFQWLAEFPNANWTIARKISLNDIKLDKHLMAFQNGDCYDDAENIIRYFNIDYWLPITVNKDFFLLDGQHRVLIARLLGLKYIDVEIRDDEFLKNKRI